MKTADDIATEFAEWIKAQHEYVAKYGIPGSDLRPW
jgi:hypothetical protein